MDPSSAGGPVSLLGELIELLREIKDGGDVEQAAAAVDAIQVIAARSKERSPIAHSPTPAPSSPLADIAPSPLSHPASHQQSSTTPTGAEPVISSEIDAVPQTDAPAPPLDSLARTPVTQAQSSDAPAAADTPSPHTLLAAAVSSSTKPSSQSRPGLARASPPPPQETPGAGPSQPKARQRATNNAKPSANSHPAATGRNLIVCIDGTSNQFSIENTNVVELYHRLIKDGRQLTFYNSGIGTYAAPSWKSWRYFKQVIYNKIDLAIAWNFEGILLSAYLWLCENYREGDKIYLFGFSRGAYQVRALSAMIESVGLLYKGNQDQIPFAYQLYAETKQFDKIKLLRKRFKETFSWDVTVELVGVWDTVSSVGLVRDKTLPGTTNGMKHVKYFRHALALHERRVKFLPEYAREGLGPLKEDTVAEPGRRPHTKEVWFAGSHSGIGGGAMPNENMNTFGPALRWMTFEATLAGVRLKDAPQKWKRIPIGDSMTSVWKIFEIFPFARLTYQGERDLTYSPHHSRPRQIQDNQLIHETALDEYLFQDSDSNLDYETEQTSDDEPDQITDDETEWQTSDDEPDQITEDDSELISDDQIPQMPGAFPLAPLDDELEKILHDESKRYPDNQYPDDDFEQMPGSFPLAQYSEDESEQPQVGTDSNKERERTSLWRALLPRSLEWDSVVLRAQHLVEADPYTAAGQYLDKITKTDFTVLPRDDVLVLETLFSTDLGRRSMLDIKTAKVTLDRGLHQVTRQVDGTKPGLVLPTIKVLLMVMEQCGFVDANSIVPEAREYARIIARTDEELARRFMKSCGSAMVVNPIEHPDEVWCVAYMPDGDRIVSGCYDCAVRIWNIETGEVVGASMPGHTESVWSVAVSADGTQIASGSADNTIRVWSVETGATIVLEGHEVAVFSVAFSPDGLRVVSGSWDETIRVWDVASGKTVVGPIQGHTPGVRSVAYSPDGSQIVSASDDFTVRVRNAETGDELWRVEESFLVYSVAYSPDGNRIVAGCNDRTVRVLDPETGEIVLGPLTGHTSGLNSVAFSPDGTKIASGSYDRTVRLWDAETGEELDVLRGHRYGVLSVAFSPDGKHVASSSGDKTVRIWDATGEWRRL